jgi:outer membrane protein OmpA-like peptidoglycan-associated protein
VDFNEVFDYTTESDGRFSVSVLHGRTYGIHVTSDGYALWSGLIAFNVSEPYDQKTIQVSLTPLYPGVTTELEIPVVLRNIQFETGSAVLLPSSVPELNLLYSLLHDNPDVRIVIQGHTDNIGSETDNQVLSESRARAVYDWLVNKQIDVARLSYKGFGETRPVANNDSEEGRQQNRRTEFVILKE